MHFIGVALLEWNLGEPAEPSRTHPSKLQNFYESVRFRHPPPILADNPEINLPLE